MTAHFSEHHGKGQDITTILVHWDLIDMYKTPGKFCERQKVKILCNLVRIIIT